MLTLLRNHQKSIFLVVTVMVVASFLFFGISNSIHTSAKEKDFVYGKAYDQSSISGREIKRLTRFLATDINDALVLEKRGVPNMLNDGALKDDLIETGIANELYVRFEEELKPELSERYTRFRGFKPYEHPQKMIGAMQVWKQYGDKEGLYQAWENFKACGPELTPKAFEAVLSLYAEQKKLPPGIVRQILLYQQHQYGEMLHQDPYLQSGELALFNAKTANEWFGPRFNELVANFIYNASIKAKELGYSVSFDEARASLIENAMRGVKQIYHSQNVTREDFARLMQSQLNHLGMTEDEATAVWQRVLLTRRWLKDMGESVFVDKEVYEDYYNYTSVSTKVDAYKLPKSMAFGQIDEMLKFEVYLDAIGQREGLLDVDVTYRSIEEMKQVCPELLEKRFILDVSTKDREEIAVNVSLKDSLEWQIQDANWNKLKEKFPVFEKYKGNSIEDRHAFIDNLDSKDRAGVDSFARSDIIKQHPEKILETLSQAKSSKKLVTIPMVKSGNIMRNLNDHKSILYLLETALIGNEITDGVDVQSATKLSCYTEDEQVYYSIRLIDRDEEFHVMSFERANKQGVLDKLLGNKLRNEFAKGKYRGDYDDALPQVKLALFRDLIEGIESYLGKSSTDFDSIDARLRFAAKHRFYVYMQGVLEDAKKGVFAEASSEDTIFDQNVLPPLRALNDSWKPARSELVLCRNDGQKKLQDELFELPVNTWSDLRVDQGEGLTFYRVLDRFVDKAPMANRIKLGRQLLSQEARMATVRDFIDDAIAKEALFIPGNAVIEADSEE